MNYLNNANKALELGKEKGAKALLSKHYKQEHKNQWLADKQAEYDAMYPATRQYTEEEYQEYVDSSEEGHTILPIEECKVAIEYITVDEEGNEVRTPAEYLTFSEWINETVVITEAVEAEYDEDGMVLVEAVAEVTEPVRPYMEDTEENIEALVSAYIGSKYSECRASAYPSIEEQLDYIYHNGVEAWKNDIIEPIKTKYPKG